MNKFVMSIIFLRKLRLDYSKKPLFILLCPKKAALINCSKSSTARAVKRRVSVTRGLQVSTSPPFLSASSRYIHMQPLLTDFLYQIDWLSSWFKPATYNCKHIPLTWAGITFRDFCGKCWSIVRPKLERSSEPCGAVGSTTRSLKRWS